MHPVARSRYSRIFAVGLTLFAAGCGDSTSPAPAPATLEFAVQPGSGVAGIVFSRAVVVNVLDANGQVASASNLSVAITVSTNGAVFGTLLVKAVKGVAVFPDLKVTTSGTAYTLKASANGVQSATSDAFDIAPAAATTLQYVIQPVSAIANTTLPVFSVAIKDAFGNTVPTANTTIVVALQPNLANATTSGTTEVVPVNGVATFSDVRITRPSTGFVMIAVSQPLVSARSNLLSATVGPVNKLSFFIEPAATRPGRPMDAIGVQTTDAAGNAVASPGGSITLRIGANPSAGTLSGTTTKALANGAAIFADLSIDNLGSDYTLIASTAGLADGISTAFDIRNALNFASISAGYFMTCGLTTTSVTYCWGDNSFFQLGSGIGGTRLVPHRVSGSNVFARISAGRDHSCGTTSAGVAFCWGNGASGMLGAANVSQNASAPIPVSGQLAFAAVEAGYSHTCGITTSGAGYCWGANESGQLGTGATNNSGTPAIVAGGFTFTSISTGRLFSCGIRTGGDAYCWGENYGVGPTPSPRVPAAVGGGQSFASITAGGTFACGLTGTGAAYCWGSTLGNGTSNASVTPVAVSGGLTFTSISAGNRHACAITTAGAAYCWGDAADGKLGVQGPNYLVPQPVLGGLTFRTISAGRFHTCGLTTAGMAYCWGGNAEGKLGDGTTNDNPSPVAVR